MTQIGLTPTTQRVEGYPFGECVRASYATLLDLPLELVPRLDPGALRPGEDQRARERAWLAMIGFDLLEIPPEPLGDLSPALLAEVPPVLHLISGISPRGFGHRCVGLGGRVLWDPHPSHAGLLAITSLGFLVPRC